MDRPPPLIEAGVLTHTGASAVERKLQISVSVLTDSRWSCWNLRRSALGTAAGVANGSEAVLPPV